MRDSVRIREVGPRDGFQNEKEFISTEVKIQTIRALIGAGLKWIEVTSFVSPKWVPQLADAAAVADAITADCPDDVTLVAFVPNLRGLERAAECGISHVTTAVTVSEELNRANFNRSTAEMVRHLPSMIAIAGEKGMTLEVTVGTAFGGTSSTDSTLEEVVAVVSDVAHAGATTITLGDTLGVANPRRVSDTFRELAALHPTTTFAAHFHDTRGLAVANALTAWQTGVAVFDASIGGLGGCPFAPGASGNVATDELAHLFEEMGVDTGIDVGKLARIVWQLEEDLGRQLPSDVAKAMAARAH